MSDLEQRIERFERNLAYMHQELREIKAEMNAMPVSPKQPPVAAPKVAAMPKEQPMRKHARKEGKSAEQFIGKVAMGVGASILIFIAMVMFATLIIPMFNDTMKMVSMYLLSILLIVAGEFVYKKSKTGYTILSACGVGALFISFVATCVYFHAIGQITLYILLLLWVFGVAFHMARNRNLAFVAVGQIGVVVATALAGFSNSVDSDFYLMIGFVILAEAIFFISFFRKSFVIDFVNVCSLALSIMILDGIAYWNVMTPGPMVAIIAVGSIALTGAMMYIYVRDLSETEGLLARILNIFICIMFAFLIGSIDRTLTVQGDWLSMFSVAYTVAMLGVGDCFGGRKGIIATRSVHAFIAIALTIGMMQDVRLGVQLVLMLLAIIYGWLSREKYYYFLAPIIYIFMGGLDVPTIIWRSMLSVYMESAWPVIAMFIGLALLLVEIVLVRLKEGEFFPFEIVAYFTMMIGIMKCIDELRLQVTFDHAMLWTLCIWVVAQIIIKKCNWCMKSKIPYYIMSGLMLLLALDVAYIDIGGVIETYNSAVTYMPDIMISIIAILASVAAFSINTKELFKITPLAGAYIAGKYTLLLIVILNAFSVPSQIMSIVLLIVAAASVAVGFKINNKSLRLYGLVLSIIAVAKLVLIDISYDNSLIRAFSFLVCGLICFAISIAYNRMERRMIKNDTNALPKSDEVITVNSVDGKDVIDEEIFDER